MSNDKNKDIATQEDLLSSIEAEMTQPRSPADMHVRETSLVLRVRAAIRRITGIDVGTVRIVATGGIVELYGELASQALVEEATTAVTKVRGAQVVVNNMSHR